MCLLRAVDGGTMAVVVEHVMFVYRDQRGGRRGLPLVGGADQRQSCSPVAAVSVSWSDKSTDGSPLTTAVRAASSTIDNTAVWCLKVNADIIMAYSRLTVVFLYTNVSVIILSHRIIHWKRLAQRLKSLMFLYWFCDFCHVIHYRLA